MVLVWHIFAVYLKNYKKRFDHCAYKNMLDFFELCIYKTNGFNSNLFSYLGMYNVSAGTKFIVLNQSKEVTF